MATKSSKRCELTIMTSKNPKLSNDEFHRYWSEEHPKIWLSVPIVQEKIIDYSQYHVDRDQCKGLEGLGLPVAQYDGIVKIAANSFEDLVAVFGDPEYQRVVVPDEEYLFDRANAVMLIGNTEIKRADSETLVSLQ